MGVMQQTASREHARDREVSIRLALQGVNHGN
jgi:hypothetical protein